VPAPYLKGTKYCPVEFGFLDLSPFGPELLFIELLKKPGLRPGFFLPDSACGIEPPLCRAILKSVEITPKNVCDVPPERRLRRERDASRNLPRPG
jgi:hypothetical protein